MSQAKPGKITHYNWTDRIKTERVASQYTASIDLFYSTYYTEPHVLRVMTTNRTPPPPHHIHSPFLPVVFNNLKHSMISLLLIVWTYRTDKNTIPSKAENDQVKSHKKKNHKERTKWNDKFLCKHVHGTERNGNKKCTFLIMQYTNFYLILCT